MYKLISQNCFHNMVSTKTAHAIKCITFGSILTARSDKHEFQDFNCVYSIRHIYFVNMVVCSLFDQNT